MGRSLERLESKGEIGKAESQAERLGTREGGREAETQGKAKLARLREVEAE